MVDGVISHAKTFNELTTHTHTQIYLQRYPQLLNLKLDEMRDHMNSSATEHMQSNNINLTG